MKVLVAAVAQMKKRNEKVEEKKRKRMRENYGRRKRSLEA